MSLPNSHTINDCPQDPKIHRMEKILDRVVVALETIAEQGAIVSGHEKRLDKHDKELFEVFSRIRKVELVHAHDAGVEEVTSTEKKFWESVKIQLADKLLLLGIFVILVADKFNIGMWVAKFWKEIFG